MQRLPGKRSSHSLLVSASDGSTLLPSHDNDALVGYDVGERLLVLAMAMTMVILMVVVKV